MLSASESYTFKYFTLLNGDPWKVGTVVINSYVKRRKTLILKVYYELRRPVCALDEVKIQAKS